MVEPPSYREARRPLVHGEARRPLVHGEARRPLVHGEARRPFVYRSLFAVLAAVCLAFLAFFSLRGALPQSGPYVELAVSLFQFVAAIVVMQSALKLGSEPRLEAPIYFALGLAFSMVALAELVHGIAIFGLGVDWTHTAGKTLELAYYAPYLLFFLLLVCVLMLMIGNLDVGNPLVVGWAISLTLFVACFVCVRSDLAHSHLPRQTQCLALVALALQCSIGGFGLLPVLFASGARFRMIGMGVVAIGLAMFLHQVCAIYHILGFLTTGFDLLFTVGEIFVVFGLIIAREESPAIAPGAKTPILPVLEQLT